MSLTYKTSTNKDLYSDFAQLNGWRYHVDGWSRPEAYDGTTTRNMSIKMNGDAPTDLTETAAGSLTQTATYKYKYTYYNSTNDVESNPSDSASITLTGANDGVTLDIPANSDVDSQVSHVRIYRTQANGNVYYYNQQVAYDGSLIDDQADNDADTSLGDPYGQLDITGILQTTTNGFAPTTKYIEAWGNRNWMCGFRPYTAGTVSVTNGNSTVTGDGTSWDESMEGWSITIGNDAQTYLVLSVASATSLTLTLDGETAENYAGATASEQSYSMLGDRGFVLFSYINDDGVIYPESFPSDHFLNINPKDGDEESGLIACGTRLLAFKKKSIYYISGNDESNYEANKMNDPIGCVSARTLTHDSSGNVVFLSEQGVHVTDGSTVKYMSSQIKNIWGYEGDAPFRINKNRMNDSHAVYDKSNDRLYLWVTSSDSTVTNKCLMGDFGLKNEYGEPEWFIFDIDANASVVYESDSGESIVAFGDEDGFIYEIGDYTNDGAGTAYTRRGTATSSANYTFTDSAATFNTAGDGYKSLYVSIIDGTGEGQRRKIDSNTSTVVTITRLWDTNPDTTSVYAIGAIESYWRGKIFHWDDLRKKIIKWVKVIFGRTTSSYNLDVTRLTDQSIEDGTKSTSYYGGKETQTVDMNDKITNYKKVYFGANKGLKHQIEIGVYDIDKPFTVKELEIGFRERGRK